jgi:MarR family transcriptional regulator, organic hydroperoxide resistance regulator
MSTENPGNRRALHAELMEQTRLLIAGAVLFNQHVADEVGLHLTDLQSLSFLVLQASVTPGTLAQWTGLTTGGVTVMLDRLARAGYIRRRPNPDDRRSVLIEVNPAKLKRLQAHYAGVVRQLETIYAGIPEAELRSAIKVMALMNATRGRRPPPPGKPPPASGRPRPRG